MAKGDYLTKPRFGKPADAIEQKAADWLEANCGFYGEEVMKSLAELIRSCAHGASAPVQRPPQMRNAIVLLEEVYTSDGRDRLRQQNSLLISQIANCNKEIRRLREALLKYGKGTEC